MMLVLQSPYPSNQILQSNRIAEYRFDEGAGQQTFNRVGSSSTPSVNLFGAPEQSFAYGGFWTDEAHATDWFATDPFGGNNASRYTGATYTTQTLSLTIGITYTVSIYVKSNTGSSQFMRINTVPTGWTANLTVPTTWTRLSLTFTAVTTGNQDVSFGVDASSTPLDILIYGAQLEVGSSASTYVPPVGHLTLGATGLADSYDPAWTSLGINHPSSSQRLLGGALTTPVTASQMTAFTVFRWPIASTPPATDNIALITEKYTLSRFRLSLADNSSTTQPSFKFNTQTAPATAATTRDGLWHVLTGTYDGVAVRVYLDDVEVGSIAASGLSAISIQTVFYSFWNGRGFGMVGDTAYAGLYSAALTPAQIKSNNTALAALLAPRGITLTTIPKFVVFEGDSITAGGSPGYGLTALRGISPIPQGRNFAITGSGIADLNTRAASVDAMYNSARAKNILSVLIGRNNMPGGNVPVYYASVKAYLQARRAVGWEVVPCTVLPSTAVGFNAERNTFNTLLKADAALYNSQSTICDFAADATMGPDAAASNATYYSDGTHPTQAGYNILGPISQAAIQTLL